MSKENIVSRVVAAALSDPSTQQFLADALSNHLQRHLAGDALYIPKKTGDQRATRNAQIRQELAAGVACSELQAKYRLTDRQIRRVRLKKS